MDYQAAASAFKTAMGNIGDALREMLGTTKQYKLTEVADAIREGNLLYYLGTGTSFDLKSLLPDIDYTQLSDSNFIVVSDGGSVDAHYNSDMYDWNCAGCRSNGNFYINKSYSATTGVLSASVTIGTSGSPIQGPGCSNQVTNAVKVYFVLGDIKTA